MRNFHNPRDASYMHHALELAAQGLGHTWPNPSVGAVIVRNGQVVGEAATARGGSPHAEPLALKQAGEKARGATLYVTLEPCSHHGKTPPCAEAIIAAGIQRVVAACTDPNPKVSGKGFALLRSAGIEVVEGVCEAEALKLNEGFFSAIARGRPFVTLKIATSADGKITTGDPFNPWLTGERSRRKVHELRGTQDAILTGIGTVLADNPQLTCRLAGREADSPQRVVMDSRLRVTPDAKALPAWIVTCDEALATEQAKLLRSRGNLLFPVPVEEGKLSLNETLRLLAQRGITRLMVEAGALLAAEFMRQKLVDRLYWFRAPITVGGKGLSVELSSVADMPKQNEERFGDDVLEIYEAPPYTGH